MGFFYGCRWCGEKFKGRQVHTLTSPSGSICWVCNGCIKKGRRAAKNPPKCGTCGYKLSCQDCEARHRGYPDAQAMIEARR